MIAAKGVAMRTVLAIVVGTFVVGLPGVASASWFYRWNCAGECAPGDVAISGNEGPFATEADCNAARDADTYHRDLVVQAGNFGMFESCVDEGDSSTGSSGGSSGPLLPHQRLHPELRPFAGVRWPVFDSGITTGKTMAGQSPDELASSATVAPGLYLAVQVDTTRWSTFYLEVAYFRNSVSSMDVPLGTVKGGSGAVGYQRTRVLGSGDWYLEWQLGVGMHYVVFAQSSQNVELAGGSISSTHFLLQSRLGLSRVLGRHLRVDLGVAAYYTPMRLEPTAVTNDDPDLWMRLGSAGTVIGLGATFL